MIANGHVVGDGSWDLRVFVTDLQTERQIRVKGDVHIGGVMLRLVEDLEISMDWSDHALWWPEQNVWLTRTRSTLDQCGVHADALLHFTPMHKNLRVQLPDLRYLDMRVDFSIKTFSAVVDVCKELGIRHPEELSFCKPLEPNHLKFNYKHLPKKKQETNGVQKNGHLPPDTNTFIANSSPAGSTGSLDNSPFMCAPVTPSRVVPHSSTPVGTPVGSMGTWKKNGYGSELNGSASYSPNVTNTSLSLEQLNGTFDSSLASSPPTPALEARKYLVRPKSLIEKARMNVGWLDSSLSIMEQGVREHGTLCLRFKFYVFYDLNPKYDAIRINQIYEQAKWQLLNEEIDCTEEEMLMFAALQLQINLQAGQPQQYQSFDSNGATPSPQEDDIDAALNNLQNTLEGSSISALSNDITSVPELKDQLRFLKPKRFTLKAYKKYWFTCRDLHLYMYKSREDMVHNLHCVMSISLKGCEVTPDVHLSQNKYVIKLEVPSADGMSEMYLRCDDETQYSRWMACCRLAAKGRSLADSSYETETAYQGSEDTSRCNDLAAQKLVQNPSISLKPNYTAINNELWRTGPTRKRISNPALSIRQLFPGEEELGLVSDIDFQNVSTRTPEGWEKSVATIQYDEDTKVLWQELQKPYGSMSSFLRHLVLLEKYFRNGDLVLSPSASHHAVNYRESVHNRLRAYDNIPSNSLQGPPSSMLQGNKMSMKTSGGGITNQSLINGLPPVTISQIGRFSENFNSKTPITLQQLNQPPLYPTNVVLQNIAASRSRPPGLISINQRAPAPAAMKTQIPSQKIKFPITKNWRPNLIPISPSKKGEKKPGLIQVVSGGKPYHITIEDYKKMCAIKRSFEAKQKRLLQEQQFTKQMPQKQQSMLVNPHSVLKTFTPKKDLVIGKSSAGTVSESKPISLIPIPSTVTSGNGSETILEKLDKQVERLSKEFAPAKISGIIFEKNPAIQIIPKIPKSLTVIPQTVSKASSSRAVLHVIKSNSNGSSNEEDSNSQP